MVRYGMGRNAFAARAYGSDARESRPPRIGPTFQRRLVTEDVPCGLVPLEQLGLLAGIPTPDMTVLISLLCSLEGQDFRAHPAARARTVNLQSFAMTGQQPREERC
jgi:opine dehydrogenase